MTNKLRHLRSSVPERVPQPADMELGQFAINSADGKVFIKKSDNTIQDITDNIFRNDTSIVITDSPASAVGNISFTVDGVEQASADNTGFKFSNEVVLEDQQGLRFSEQTVNGTEYVELRAPDSLDASYSLKLPTATGTVGQLIGTNGLGDLRWYDADVFGGNRVYVSQAKGDDANDGITAPVRTIKRALQIASGFVYDNFGVPNGQRWNVQVAAGEYYENNPIIVPDNVSVIGDGLRACILRPNNADQDMLRVRNGCYFTEFTFRDALAGAPATPDPIGAPTYTFNYAVAFDDPLDTTVDRVGYTNLPNTRPVISISPYIQNCSIISFLGGNGVLVDGSKVDTPNRPQNNIEVENPVNISDGIPEQGKSMVANAFTMLSFGGTGWRVINDAYVQIVSCFQIFMLNGTYTQSGGYCSVTNSATNFGLYALRASGYSPNAFAFDRGYIATTGTNNSRQTMTAFGFTRPNGPVEEFVVRLYDPTTEADLTDNTFKLTLPGFGEATFDAATDVVPGTPGQFNITAHGYLNGDEVTYFADGGTPIGGMFDGDTYFVQVINPNSFILAFDDSYTRFVNVSSAGTGTQFFRRNDYEMIVNELLDSHNTFQTLTLTPGVYTFNPGDLVTGNDTAPPGLPHSGYVYSYNPVSYELVVVINRVTVGITESRVTFNSTSQITEVNGVTLGSPITLTGVASRVDLWAATFEMVPTSVGGQFTNLINLPGKKVWFHRPSITNSSAHTWEYAGSGIDYNALPQNGGKTIEKYEQYSERAGQVYTSGTNELGDFKVGDFIRAFNRTGNVQFTNKVTIDQLDVLRLALSDVEITAISTDPDLGENEVGGPLDSRLSTQKSIWSYANNRLGPFIDKSVSTNAVPGNIVQLNANGQINRDLIPSQRNFSSFVTQGFNSRITLADDIPTNDSQSGDICTERFEQVGLILDNPVTVQQGWLVVQANTGATGYIKENVTSGNNIVVASIFGTFETAPFNTTDTLTINGDSTPGDGNLAVIPTNVGPETPATGNYFISSSTSSQYLITPNATLFTYTNVPVISAVRYNDISYVVTNSAHNLLSNTRIQLNLTDDDFDRIDYATILSTTSLRLPSPGLDTPATGSTTATATIVGTTGTSTTGSVLDAALTGTIVLGDWVFGGGLPLGSRITAVNLAGNPNTFTVTFPGTFTVAGTSTAQLTFISPTVRTGTVKSVITAADSLASGAFDEVRTGVLTSVNNLSYIGGTLYTPASGSQVYLRVPFTNISGTGTGALADITVANGTITDVDIVRGGTGYQVGDVLSVNSANVGGTGSGFQITVTAVEQRIYVDIVGGNLFVATTGAIDFVEDNNSPRATITATSSTTTGFNSLPIGSGGSVDYATSRITITTHPYQDGDPVQYDPSPNVAIGGLTVGNVYYVKSIDANTIELYDDYSLLSKMNFGTSSTGTHNLTRYAVNLADNSFYAPAHGFVTGDAVRMSGSDLPSYLVGASTIQIANNTYFFVGSVTQNSFTIHELRSDALASVNGITSVAYDINQQGTGTIEFIDSDITITGVVNTSSQYLENWSVLVADNIDASNIVSGIISPTRLGLGSATDETFLRGDSQYVTAVQTVEFIDNNPNPNINTGGLLTVNGSVNGTYTLNDRSGFVTVDIQRANETTGDYSTIGAASFFKSHFTVGSTGDALQTNGQVYIKPTTQGGTVDAATLETRNLSYVLDSVNHTTQPVAQGGTNITSYTTGDLIYASGTTILSKLAIGSANTVLTSSGSAPQWSTSLTLAGDLAVNGGDITSTASPFNLLNQPATVNAFAAATALNLANVSTAAKTVNIGTASTGITTVNIGGAVSGNTLEINSTTGGTINLTSDVTTGTVNLYTGVSTGTINLGSITSTTRLGVTNLRSQAFTTTTNTTGITSVTSVLVDSFDLATFRSGEYTMQITCTAGTNVNTHQISKLLLVHDGTTPTLTEYGVIRTGPVELATFTTNVNAGNIEVRAQASAGNTVTVKLVRTLQVV
jgi:hypothetical protein